MTSFKNIGIAVMVVSTAIPACLAPARGAECPITLDSVGYAGQAASGAFVSYGVEIKGPISTFASVRFALETSRGHDLGTTTWQDVAVAHPLNDAHQAPEADGTFDWRTADVAAVALDSVTPSNGQPIECDRSWVPVGDHDRNWFVLVNDRVHGFDAQVVGRSSVSAVVRDSDFIHRSVPEYPAIAAETGIQGNVTVRITVDVDGKPEKVSIDSSSQNDYLDLAALDAARSSTFHPAVVNGKTVERDYLIIYTFRLDGAPARALPVSTCPLTVTDMILDNAGKPTSPDWYHISFKATRSDIVKAQLTFLDIAGLLLQQSWEQISLGPLTGSDKTVSTTAVIAWEGEDPSKAWVDDVTFADGTDMKCSPYYELVDRPHAAGPLPRTLNAQLRVAGLQSLRDDVPVSTTYPVYPKAALDSDQTGHANVDVLVDSAGKVVGAVLAGTSNNESLDAAAMASALKMRYAAAASHNYFPIRIIGITYDFVDTP